MTEEEEVGSPRIYHPGSTLLAPPSDGGGSGPSSSSFGAILDRIKSHIMVRAPKKGGHKKLPVSELKVLVGEGTASLEEEDIYHPDEIELCSFFVQGAIFRPCIVAHQMSQRAAEKNLEP